MVGRNNFTGYGLGVRRVLGAVQSRVQTDDNTALHLPRRSFHRSSDDLQTRPTGPRYCAFLVLNFGEASQCEEENR